MMEEHAQRSKTRPDTRSDFRSDNVGPASSEILVAVGAANGGTSSSYGEDEYSHKLDLRFSEVFEKEVKVFPVSTGTAANALSISALTPPYGGVLCHEMAHIHTSEGGALELFSGGAKLMLQPGEHFRLQPDRLAETVANAMDGRRHKPKPSAISVTQATEHGTIYRLSELEEIGRIARQNGLKLHMDGARFANALATLGCSPADATWRRGVDILSFGATKNGGLSTDAIVVFNLDLVEDLSYRLRRSGQTWSKMRFAAAQLIAYVDDGLFLKSARRANALASRFAAGITTLQEARLVAPVEANEIFVGLPDAVISRLANDGYLFSRWRPGVARFVCRFDGVDGDVDDMVAAISEALDLAD
jgi:threonine aldolase